MGKQRAIAENINIRADEIERYVSELTSKLSGDFMVFHAESKEVYLSAELSHIFDSFWRGSNVGNQSGNGLGLYICRRLMNEMSGDIFAQIRNDTMCVTVVCHKFS